MSTQAPIPASERAGTPSSSNGHAEPQPDQRSSPFQQASVQQQAQSPAAQLPPQPLPAPPQRLMKQVSLTCDEQSTSQLAASSHLRCCQCGWPSAAYGMVVNIHVKVLCQWPGQQRGVPVPAAAAVRAAAADRGRHLRLGRQ